ncbi:MAG TPA: M28 family peptidase [Gemmatimonadaceae bacterium]|nr:M28 family peptidase [Gemmatimonadaceae bacterium]
MSAAAHLARLGAAGRPAGSAAADAARAYCAAILADSGFLILEQTFEYSKAAGAWATPAAGLAAGLIATAFALSRVPRREPHWGALALGVLLVVGIAFAHLGRRGVLGFPLMRRRGVNLQATRDGDDPKIWLVAHLDSKWQPVSMIARVAGVSIAALGLATLVVVGALNATAPLWIPLALTWLGAIPLILSTVGARNAGALDNASGVAAVLGAAELIPRDANVGILITDAEELALAGARAWALCRTPACAINCASVDDDGELVLMYTRSRPRLLISRCADAALATCGRTPRVSRLIPGILTDSVALADAGWEAVTLSRGNLRTLQRIHTSRDTLSELRGTALATVAAILARVATELA